MFFISSQNMRRYRSKVINYNGYTLTHYHIALITYDEFNNKYTKVHITYDEFNNKYTKVLITYDEFNNKYTKVDILFSAQKTFWNNLLQGGSKSKDWRTNQFKERTRRAH